MDPALRSFVMDEHMCKQRHDWPEGLKFPQPVSAQLHEDHQVGGGGGQGGGGWLGGAGAGTCLGNCIASPDRFHVTGSGCWSVEREACGAINRGVHTAGQLVVGGAGGRYMRQV